MLGWLPASNMRGVRMQAEQSSVGKVLSSWAMCPPRLGSRSTRETWKPALGVSGAAGAAPPPAADNQRVRVDGRALFHQGLVMGHSTDGCGDQRLGFLGRFVF